ncbi:FtsX-like permease family protein [Varibaculum vaginae]|uniref:FtsX-like permease family protein n=1 Tax=Varibaculum vaginae TaxID=2364797 RepID=UPI000F09223B|nr:FtsX-like permease family protein [Varibaculum vaginae]
MSSTNIASPAVSARTQNLNWLTWHLTKARFRSRQGESLLYLASILAYTVCAGLALTIAGGTYMFYHRWMHPTGIAAQLLKVDASFEIILKFYFLLAILACTLIIPSLCSLATKAAVLGARGREKRLAALRLLGLSSLEVTKITMLDALLQAVIGSLIGTTLYLATLPTWTSLKIEAKFIAAKEMLLPWWLLLTVLAVMIFLGQISSWWGMQQVRVSPLGVTRRASQPALRVWRLVAAIAIFVTAFIVSQLTLGLSKTWILVALSGIILVVILGFNLLGPYLLQLNARLLAKVPTPAMVLASRRIAADPKTTWRRVSGMGFLAFIAGFVAMSPVLVNSEDSDNLSNNFISSTRWDFHTGTMITLAVSFTLCACAMLITQAATVIENAQQSRALAKMGAPRGFELRSMWLETLGPLAVSVLGGGLLGLIAAMPMVQMLKEHTGQTPENSVTQMSLLLLAGLAFTAASIFATHPLHRRLRLLQQRAND